MERLTLKVPNLFLASLATIFFATNGCGGGDVSISVLPSIDEFQQNTNADVKIDILFVVDDSGSMKPEQQALYNEFGKFINFFYDKGFDFRIAVAKTSAYGSTINCKRKPDHPTNPNQNRTCQNSTTGTDPYYKKDVGGNFIAGDYIARENGLTPKEFRCGYGNNCGLNQNYQTTTNIPDTEDDGETPEPLKTTIGNGTPGPDTDHILASTNLTKTQMINKFKVNITVGLAGTGDERSLEAAETTIRNMKQFYPDPNQQFPRPNSHLAIIHVGDENDGPIPNNLAQDSTGTALTGSNSNSTWGSLRSVHINNLTNWPDYDPITLVSNGDLSIDNHLASVNSYLDALKSHDATTTVSVHAIQDLPSAANVPFFLLPGTSDTTSNSSFGLVGYFMAYMAQLSGGLVFSKDSAFGPSLSAMGDTISSLASFFQLGGPLDAFAQSNLKVYVEGINGNNPIPNSDVNGYQYEPSTNRIRFYGSMIPPQGAIIGLQYTCGSLDPMICYTPE